MECPNMVYDKNKVRELLQEVKNFNITVTKKAVHEPKKWELKKLYNKCAELNYWLFDADEEYNYRNYKQVIELKDTNKELNKKLKLCLLYLHNQLFSILNEY